MHQSRPAWNPNQTLRSRPATLSSNSWNKQAQTRVSSWYYTHWQSKVLWKKKKKKRFCALTFEDKEKRECWRNRKVLRFSPSVSRLSLSLWARLCIEALCGLCGWKAALLDPDQVIDSTTQECPISFVFLSSFFSPPWDNLHLLSQRVGSLFVGAVRRCSLRFQHHL